MLLITDRSDGNPELARRLGLLRPCAVLILGREAPKADQPVSIVVGDVDLGRRESVEAMRQALARHRGQGAPYLCLLREMTVRTAIQARAIGATEVLPADAAAALLVKTIEQLLGEGRGR
ncbi:MAG: hypothetical protein C0420_06420 [Methylobacterium sp.]|nr:hypothetical protein [Methylobacterium sp.]